MNLISYCTFNKSDPILDYKLKSVTFGVSSAPFLAIRLMRHIAKQEKALTKYPLAVKACLKEFYVDDLLSGHHSDFLAVRKISDIHLLLESAGLTLRKWSTNSKNVLQNIPIELRET